jgi:hypothetical protein
LFILGHVGIGTRLLGPLRRRLPAAWLVLGCLLPDLIDKPLFYGLLWLRGRPDALISGTRTIGHSGLFLLALAGVAGVTRSRAVWAVAAGVLTHLILDALGEAFIKPDPTTYIWLAIFFPLLGRRFPVAHFGSISEHLRMGAQSAYVIAGEILGLAILLRAWLSRHKSRHTSRHTSHTSP